MGIWDTGSECKILVVKEYILSNFWVLSSVTNKKNIENKNNSYEDPILGTILLAKKHSA